MNNNQKNIGKRILQGIVLLVLIGLIVLLVTQWEHIWNLFTNKELLEETVSKYGFFSSVIMVGLQALQIVVAFIPGEITQIAAGYLFGTVQGAIISFIGLFIGAAITFYIARILGHDFVKKVIKKEQYEKFSNLLNSSKGEGVLFILLLIPGLPKDFLFYLMGITDIQAKRFFFIVMIARTPSIIGSAIIGANLADNNLSIAISISIFAIIVVVIGLIFKDRIIAFLDKRNNK